MMDNFPSTQATFLLSGPSGLLETATTAVIAEKDRRATAIICHPHPLYGGTMNNKVVTTLMHTFQHLGLRTVRFNFRGVGKSTGHYAEGQGELEDLLAVVQWVKAVRPHDAIWLAGFSFGAFIVIQAASQLPIAQLVTIAPPVPYFPLDQLPPITCPWVLVQGDQDEVVDSNQVMAWIETLHPQPKVIGMEGAGHFFHGRLVELRQVLESVLRS